MERVFRILPVAKNAIANAEHSLVDGSPKEIDEAYRKAFSFLKEKLEQP